MDRLKSLKDYGLTQSMLAYKLKRPRQLINRWFTGAAMPSVRSLTKIADAMTELTKTDISVAQVFEMLEYEKKQREV